MTDEDVKEIKEALGDIAGAMTDDNCEGVGLLLSQIADEVYGWRRESTAATVLAALIQAGRSVQAGSVHEPLRPGIVNTVSEAIGLADYLRAELAKRGTP